MKLQLQICLILISTISSFGQVLTKYVDPFIGTGGKGHTYPGATVPFGMVQISPDTRNNDYKSCAGYHYSDSTIIGFSQTHLSGTGIGDMGDILVQPVSHDPRSSIVNDPTGYPYRSSFSHINESATPGYYQVYLKDNGVNVELTASKRVGMYRFNFDQTDTTSLVVDLWHNLINWQANTTQWANIQVLNDSTITGYRLTHAWAHERYVYFAMRFSKPMKDWTIINMLQRDRLLQRESYSMGMKPIKMVADFSLKKGESLLMKVGISGTSINGALRNMEEEIPSWDFEGMRNNALNLWEKELSRVEIEAENTTKRIFYTALYHCFLAPVIYNDVDGSYRGIDQNIYKSARQNYTVFSLWDTFRALHPLFTIIQQNRTGDMIYSMLEHYKQYSRKMLPIWSFHANETNCMIGYHAVPVIADAYLKGIVNYDTIKALDAMVQTANNTMYDGLNWYKKYGYVPIDFEKEAASKTLEYAFDDWSIAQMAHKMKREDIDETFTARSQNYRHIFDAKTGFMRARLSDGSFKEPFNPGKDNFAGGDFTEGNSWRYSWFVPHDIEGLINLHGSAKKFEAKLDEFFSVPQSSQADDYLYHGNPSMIGEYGHTNEPVHHVAYLYNYCGAPRKTQDIVYRVMSDLYKDSPDGLIGNDDCGQMSAWYVFSAMGFYPTNPVGGRYDMGLPLVDKAILHLENGQQFTIKVEDRKQKAQHISKVLLNGEEIKNFRLQHSDIMHGGELRIVLF